MQNVLPKSVDYNTNVQWKVRTHSYLSRFLLGQTLFARNTSFNRPAPNADVFENVWNWLAIELIKLIQNIFGFSLICVDRRWYFSFATRLHTSKNLSETLNAFTQMGVLWNLGNLKTLQENITQLLLLFWAILSNTWGEKYAKMNNVFVIWCTALWPRGCFYKCFIKKLVLV